MTDPWLAAFRPQTSPAAPTTAGIEGFSNFLDIASPQLTDFVATIKKKAGVWKSTQLHTVARVQARMLDAFAKGRQFDIVKGRIPNTKANTGDIALETGCDCTSCRALTSPVAYLADLITFANASLYEGSGPISPSWANRLLQPVDELELSCAEVDEEVLQIRIAIESLRGWLKTHSPALKPPKLIALASKEEQYRRDAYLALLVQLGLPFDMLRSASVRRKEVALAASRLGLHPEQLNPDKQTLLTQLLLDPRVTTLEASLEELFGLPVTTRYATAPQHVLSRGAPLNDTAGLLKRWRIDGARWGVSTDAEGQVHLILEKRGSDAEVRFYRDAARTDLVATAVIPGATTLARVHPDNASGASGVIQIGALQAATRTISIAAIPRFVAWRLAALRRQWWEQDWGEDSVPNNRPLAGSGPPMRAMVVIEPDLTGPDDYRVPFPTDAYFQIWLARRAWVDAVGVALEGARTISATLKKLFEEIEFLDVPHAGAAIIGWWTAGAGAAPALDRIAQRLENIVPAASEPTSASADEAIADRLNKEILDTYGLPLEAFQRLLALRAANVATAPSDLKSDVWTELKAILIRAAKHAVLQKWLDEEDAAGVQLGRFNHVPVAAEPDDGFWPPVLLTIADPSNPTRTVKLPWIDPARTKVTDLPRGPAGLEARMLWFARRAEVAGLRATWKTTAEQFGLVKLIADQMNALSSVLGGQGYNPGRLTQLELELGDALLAGTALALVLTETGIIEADFRRLLELRNVDPATPELIGEATAILLEAHRTVSLRAKWRSEEAALDQAPWKGGAHALPRWLAPAEDRAAWRSALDASISAPLIEPDLLEEADFEAARPGQQALAVFVQRRKDTEAKHAKLLTDAKALAGQTVRKLDVFLYEELFAQDLRDAASDRWELLLPDAAAARTQYLPFAFATEAEVNASAAAATPAEELEAAESLLIGVTDCTDLSGALTAGAWPRTAVAELFARQELLGSVYRLAYDAREVGGGRRPLNELALTSEETERILEVRAAIVCGKVLDQDFEDLAAILTQVWKRKRDDWRQLERKQRFVLGPERFRIPKPDLAVFPPPPELVPPAWRGTTRARRLWQRTLAGRIEQEASLLKGGATAVREVEITTLPILRDALIDALREMKGSVEERVEECRARLQERLLIVLSSASKELTTRVAQVIASVKTMVITAHDRAFEHAWLNVLERAEQFDEEWKILGSYSAWRSVMFVFMYPENLLMPALLPASLRTSGFHAALEALKSAGLLAPTGACAVADTYSDYFLDVCDLNVTAGCEMRVHLRASPCGTHPAMEVRRLFSFGISSEDRDRKVYWRWSQDAKGDGKTRVDVAQQYWAPIAGLSGCTEIAGAVAYRVPGSRTSTLFLFVTIVKDGKPQFGCVRLDDTGRWTELQEIGMPDGQAVRQARMVQSLQAERRPRVVAHLDDNSLRSALLNEAATDTNEWDTLIAADEHPLFGVSAIATLQVMRLEAATAVSTALDDYFVVASFDKAPNSSPTVLMAACGCECKPTGNGGFNVTGPLVPPCPQGHKEKDPVREPSSLPAYRVFGGLDDGRWRVVDTSLSYSSAAPGGWYEGTQSVFPAVLDTDGQMTAAYQNVFWGVQDSVTTIRLVALGSRNVPILTSIPFSGDAVRAWVRAIAPQAMDKFKVTDEMIKAISTDTKFQQALQGTKALDLFWVLGDFPLFGILFVPAMIAALKAAGIGRWLAPSMGITPDQRCEIAALRLGAKAFFTGGWAVLDRPDKMDAPDVSIYPPVMMSGETSSLTRIVCCSGILGTKSYEARPTTAITGEPFDLVWLIPEVSAGVAVSSANDDARRNQVATIYQANAKAPEHVLHYLDEAFFYLPMQLALGLQKAAEYPTSLAWMRSVYDYADKPADRETWIDQRIATVGASRPQAWLDDPVNPHGVARTRKGAYTFYAALTAVSIILDYADAEFSTDDQGSIQHARELYELALAILRLVAPPTPLPSCSDALDSARWRLDKKLTLTAAERAALLDVLRGLGSRIGITRFVDAVTARSSSARVVWEFRKAAALPQTFGESFAGRRRGIAVRRAQGLKDPNLVKGLSVAAITIGHHYKSQAVAALFAVAPVVPNTAVATREITKARNTLDAWAAGSGWLAPDLVGWEPGDDICPPFEGATMPEIFEVPPREIPLPDLGTSNLPAVTVYTYCIPPNPVLEAFTLHAKLNLYKLDTGRNIAGVEREVDPYGAPTDATTGMVAFGSSTLPVIGLKPPPPSIYRFEALLQRAEKLVQYASQFETGMLSALEKRDSEAYQVLRAKHDIREGRARERLTTLQQSAAQDQVKLYELQWEKAEFGLGYYTDLVADGPLQEEIGAVNTLITAAVISWAGVAATATAAVLNAVLQNYGGAAALAATALQESGGALSLTSQVLSLGASYKRQQAERVLQKSLAEHDVSISRQQVQVSKDQVAIAGQETAIARLNREFSESTLEFLSTKFTNRELYAWMAAVLQQNYSYFLRQAAAIARAAEAQLAFERGEPMTNIVQGDYWAPADTETGADTKVDRKGLTGAARLTRALAEVEQYAFDSRKRTQPVSRQLSLKNLDPVAFNRLKSTGVAMFRTPMALFDHETPGHYLRLIRRVSVWIDGLGSTSFPVQGALTNLGISRVTQGPPTFLPTIVRCAPQTFDLRALPVGADPSAIPQLLAPFEGLGVDTAWELRIPRAANRVDFSTLSDVLFTIHYTQLYSNDLYERVKREVGTEFESVKVISLKNSYKDEWDKLSDIARIPPVLSMQFDTTRENFLANLDDLRMKSIGLVVVGELTGVEVPIESLRFREDGSTAELGGAATTIDGAASTSLGNAGSWSAMLGRSPVGHFTLSLQNRPRIRDLFATSNPAIKDILLVIGYVGETPGWL